MLLKRGNFVTRDDQFLLFSEGDKNVVLNGAKKASWQFRKGSSSS